MGGERTRRTSRTSDAERGRPQSVAARRGSGGSSGRVLTRGAPHAACLELLESRPGLLLVPTLVITEVTYRELPLGTVDASVIAAAERLAVSEITTVHRRHFTVVRSVAGRFTSLP